MSGTVFLFFLFRRQFSQIGTKPRLVVLFKRYIICLIMLTKKPESLFRSLLYVFHRLFCIVLDSKHFGKLLPVGINVIVCLATEMVYTAYVSTMDRLCLVQLLCVRGLVHVSGRLI